MPTRYNTRNEKRRHSPVPQIWMTVWDVAYACDVHIISVYGWMKEGKLIPIPCRARLLRFDAKEVEGFFPGALATLRARAKEVAADKKPPQEKTDGKA